MGRDAPIMPLALSHLAIAAELHSAAFGDEAWSESALRDVLGMPGAFGALALCAGADPLSPAHGVAALQRSAEPIGFYIGLLLGQEAELLTLGVSPAHRGRGHGKALVEHFLECAAKAGALEAFLEVAADNDTAINLYSSLDFLRVGRRRDYYERRGNTRVSALILRRLFR
jgi:ribosomal-protein-alanine N-acetyltransferase